MTRSWRLESSALLTLWAAATALLLLIARIPHRPVRSPSFSHSTVLLRAPARRPPVARTTPARATSAAVTAPETAESPAAEAPSVVSESPVDVTEIEGIEVSGEPYDGYFGEYDSELDYYRWQYESRWGGVHSYRSWHIRRGRLLRPASSAFFSNGSVPLGMADDPCAVIPGACTETRDGGAYQPSAATPGAVSAVVIAHRDFAAPAAVTRDGDRWYLGNGNVTIAFDALCRMTTRRGDDPLTSVASFDPPAPAPCVVREIAVPWEDRAGAAIELSWSAPGGSMRAVVALADGEAAAEASVARTSPSGETWLTNLGKTDLTWIIAGSPVTVTPGGAVRVAARRSAGA